MIEFIEMSKLENEENLIKILRAYLVEKTDRCSKYTSTISLACFENKKFIGGITGNIEFESCFIDLLAVDVDYRKMKLGAELLEKAEVAAKQKGCKTIVLNTQDFQAKEFYLKQGYIVFGEISDVPFEGTTRFYLKKLI
ncbi:MAG: GNAT family N-acetyltransferase [Turicibacter sp.]